MKSDLEIAVESSKTLEGLLERNYGASGRGLHEKLNSVADRLSPQTLRDGRFVATVRNKIVHESATQRLDDRARFTTVVQRLTQELAAGPAKSGGSTRTASGWFGRSSPRPAARRGGVSRPPFSFRRLSAGKGKYRELVAVAGVALAFLVSTRNHLDFMTSLFFAALGGVAGYWWNRVLAATVILLCGVSVLLCLYYLYNVSKP